MEKNQADLKGPIEVGASGQIKEWYNETTLNTDENGNQMGQGYGHRHISHMLGLYPGDLIAQSDEWLAAAKVSMQNRTDETTGWAMAQRVATWARLAEGDKAYDVLSKMVTSGKIMTNLWIHTLRSRSTETSVTQRQLRKCLFRATWVTST